MNNNADGRTEEQKRDFNDKLGLAKKRSKARSEQIQKIRDANGTHAYSLVDESALDENGIPQQGNYAVDSLGRKMGSPKPTMAKQKRYNPLDL